MSNPVNIVKTTSSFAHADTKTQMDIQTLIKDRQQMIYCNNTNIIILIKNTF